MTIEPCVVWFTGLSGSGKSTLADATYDVLRTQQPAERLDGDELRQLFPGTGFSAHERDRHIRVAGFLAGTLERHGICVVASFISPYAAGRELARSRAKRFVEIYLSTSLEECERRDPKGLYGAARRGEIADFTGISAPYEVPSRPELTLDTASLTVEQCLHRILGTIAGSTANK
jgi:adenylylsulfate kinase